MNPDPLYVPEDEPQPAGVGMVNTAEAVVLLGLTLAALSGFVLCALVALLVYVWRNR